MDSIHAKYGIDPAQFEHVRFEAGHLIFDEKDGADRAYLIESGVVEIFKTGAAGEKSTIALLKPGGLFGAMGLITNKPRSASAKAMTDIVCYAIEKHHFDAMMDGLEAFPQLVLRQLLQDLYRLTNIYANAV